MFSGPFKDFPQVTVYHPSSGNGNLFANIGWTGWIGSITGKAYQNKHYAGPPILNIYYPFTNERISVYLDKHNYMSFDEKEYIVKQISRLSKDVCI